MWLRRFALVSIRMTRLISPPRGRGVTTDLRYTASSIFAKLLSWMSSMAAADTFDISGPSSFNPIRSGGRSAPEYRHHALAVIAGHSPNVCISKECFSLVALAVAPSSNPAKTGTLVFWRAGISLRVSISSVICVLPVFMSGMSKSGYRELHFVLGMAHEDTERRTRIRQRWTAKHG